MKNKPTILATKSQGRGLMLSAYISLYLLLEHLSAHSVFYWLLGGLFSITTFVFIFRNYLYNIITLEQILENK